MNTPTPTAATQPAGVWLQGRDQTRAHFYERYEFGHYLWSTCSRALHPGDDLRGATEMGERCMNCVKALAAAS